MFGLSAVSQMMAQDAVFSPPIGRNQQIPRCRPDLHVLNFAPCAESSHGLTRFLREHPELRHLSAAGLVANYGGSNCHRCVLCDNKGQDEHPGGDFPYMERKKDRPTYANRRSAATSLFPCGQMASMSLRVICARYLDFVTWRYILQGMSERRFYILSCKLKSNGAS
jgi:hypothetical protein